MWRWWLCVCLLWAACAYAQDLNGEIVSVVQVPSCSALPRDDLAVLYESEPGSGATGTDGTKCGVLGESTPVTTLTLAVQANQVASQNSLVFTVDQADNTPNQRFEQPLIVRLRSSGIVIVHPLKRNMNPVAYGEYWVESAEIDPQAFSLPDSTNYFTEYVSSVDSSVLNNVESPFEVTDNAGNVGRTGVTSVCPSRSAANQLSGAELEFYPTFPEFTDPDTGQFRSTVADPLLLFCPVLSGAGEDVEKWKAGYVDQIVAQSVLWDIAEAPRTMANVIVEVGFMVAGPNGTEVFQLVTSLNLSTLQDGADVVDPLGLVVGAMVGVETLGPLGQPMQGSILETAACVYGGDGDDPSCKNGMRTDYAQPVTGGDFDFVYTTIPWRGSDAVANKCPIPAQVCSQQLFGDEDVRSEWHYQTPLQRALGFGRGCAKNGHAADFYGSEPAAAELMCALGMQGTCAAGYQQGGASQLTSSASGATVTPCEVDVDNSIRLNDYVNNGAVASFTNAMPGDFNPINPQYAKDGNRLIEAVDGDASITYTVLLTLSATYVGDVVTVAQGEIVASGMVCGTPDNSAAGSVRVQVFNPEPDVAGSYIADATFDTSDASYEVTNVAPCTLSLEPKTTGACDIGFTFSGPIDVSLVADVTLTSTVATAGTGQYELDEASVQCVIAAEVTGDGTFGSASVHALIDRSGNLIDFDAVDCPAYYFCIFCQPDSTEGYLWCACFWGLLAASLLLLVVSCCFWGLGAFERIVTLRTQKKAVNAMKNGISLASVLAMLSLPMGALASPQGVAASTARASVLCVLASCAACALWTRARSGSAASAQGLAAVALLTVALLAPCGAGQGRITDVSSFQQYAAITDPSGTTLDPLGGTFVTTTTLELTTAVQGGISSFSYQEDFTVVPTQDDADAASAQTSGTLCASLKNATCQSTNRARVELDIDQAVLVSRLTQVEGFNNGYSTLPWSYYYNWVTEVMDSNDPGVQDVGSLLNNQGAIITGSCVLLSSASTGADTPFPQGVDLATMFADQNSNSDFLRCPANSEPPLGPLGPTAPGALQYIFVCQHACTGSANQCSTTLFLVANFQPTQPTCDLYEISSLPSLAADVELRITSPALGLNETAQVSSITTSLQGATAVSTPTGQAALQILGVSGGGGGLGPSLGEYLVTCTGDGSALSMVNAETAQGASSVPPSSLSFNPYRALGLEYDDDDATEEPSLGTCAISGGQYATNNLMPESCTIELLTGVSDAYAMMAIINATSVASIGSLAGQWGLDAQLYAHAPPQLLLGGNSAANTVNVVMASIIPRTQGGTGNFNNFFTGVPPFGRGFLDLEPFTAATIMGDMRSYQYSNDGPQGAQPAPFMPSSYRNHNRVPNIWTRVPAGGGAPLLLMEPSDRAYLIKATVTTTEGAISYRTRVPSGDIDNSRVYCTVALVEGVAIDGFVNYQVCNRLAEGAPANYRLTVTCGANSAFRPALGDFDPALPPSARMEPASVILANVAPGECRNPLSSGDIFFETLYSLESIANGTNPVRCVYDLTSEDTEVPSDMGLEKLSVQCAVSSALAAQVGNSTAGLGYGYGYAPLDYRDPLEPPDREPDQDGNGGGDSTRNITTGEMIALAVVAGGLVLLGIGIALCACVVAIRSRRLSKELNDPGKMAQKQKRE